MMEVPVRTLQDADLVGDCGSHMKLWIAQRLWAAHLKMQGAQPRKSQARIHRHHQRMITEECHRDLPSCITESFPSLPTEDSRSLNYKTNLCVSVKSERATFEGCMCCIGNRYKVTFYNICVLLCQLPASCLPNYRSQTLHWCQNQEPKSSSSSSSIGSSIIISHKQYYVEPAGVLVRA